jgi:NADPH:quinone reductase-like Zn-dependent oxidoreductase
MSPSSWQDGLDRLASLTATQAISLVLWDRTATVRGIAMTENIKDQVVVITGASSGLGESASRYPSGLGAKVVLGARRIDRLQNLAREIGACDDAVVETNVTRREDRHSHVTGKNRLAEMLSLRKATASTRPSAAVQCSVI